MKFEIINKAKHDRPSGDEVPREVKPAIITIGGVPFVSPDPSNPTHAREINDVVDELELLFE